MGNTLKSFRLRNFKSYKDAEFNLSPVTLIVGENASGKTNALEALRFMKRLAQGARLDEIRKALNKRSPFIRGGVQGLFYPDTSSFEMAFVFGDANEYKLQIAIEYNGESFVYAKEILTDSREKFTLYEIVANSRESVDVRYNDFNDKASEKPIAQCSSQQAIFYQSFSGTSLAEKIPSISKSLREQFSNIIFLSPKPENMRGYASIHGKVISEDASNVSAILEQICDNPESKDALFSILKDIAPNIRDIKFVETPLCDVILQLVEGISERPIPATMLSDGTLRVLSISAALLSVPRGSILVFENIDNGIHPSRMKALWEKVYQYAKERKLQVIITTHNPALMNAIEQDKIGNVLYCYRDNNGNSITTKLKNMTNFRDFITSEGSLGAAMTTLNF